MCGCDRGCAVQQARDQGAQARGFRDTGDENRAQGDAELVVDGSVLSSALTNRLEVSTLGSLKLTVEINDDGVYFKAPGSTAKVVTADVEAKNGVVHLLDTVLLPS